MTSFCTTRPRRGDRRERGLVVVLGIVLLLASGCASSSGRSRPPQSLLLPCTQSSCVRILSWNVHGLPFQSGTRERLHRIANLIADQQPDVVLLQEVWFGVYKRLLADAIHPDYQIVYVPRVGTYWPRGGLLAFVRHGSGWRPTQSSFKPFDASAPWCRVTEGDGLAGKGFLVARLENGKASWVVINTHLQSQYGARRPYDTERRKQIEELSQFVQREELTGTPVVIAGDFNTAATEPLYDSLLKATLGRDLTEEEREGCKCGSHFDDDGGRQEWIDYAFVSHWTVKAKITRIENDFSDNPYSDHDGLLIRLEYDEATVRPQDPSK